MDDDIIGFAGADELAALADIKGVPLRPYAEDAGLSRFRGVYMLTPAQAARVREQLEAMPDAPAKH